MLDLLLVTPAVENVWAKAQVDDSDRAITQRIRQASQLGKLCLSLAKAKPVAPAPPRKA